MVNIPSGFAQAILVWAITGNPRPALTTMGVSLLSPPDAADATRLGGHWMTACGPNIATPTTLVSVKLLIGDPPNPHIVVEGSVGVAGTASTAMASLDDAFLIKKQTGVGGRRNRGRLYQMGISEAAVDAAGAITSGTISDWNTDLAAFLTAVDGDAVFEAIQILHEDVGAPTPVVSMVCDGRLANQRRRIGR